jgi:AraC-like DNA-binding protein
VFVLHTRAFNGIILEEPGKMPPGGESRRLWAISPAEGLVICPPESESYASKLGLDYTSGPDVYETILTNQGMAVTVLPSADTGWLFISAIPMNEYASELIKVQRVYAVFLIICAVAGVLVSIILAYRNYLRYERELRKQRAVLALNNLIKMLRGAFYTNEAFIAACRDYGFKFSTDKYLVVCAAFKDYDPKRLGAADEESESGNSVEVAGFIVSSVIESALNKHGDCYGCFYDDYVYCVVSQKNGAEPTDVFTAAVKAGCEQAAGLISERYMIENAFIYISDIYQNDRSHAKAIHEAYMESRWGIEQMEGFQFAENIMNAADIAAHTEKNAAKRGEANTPAPLSAEIAGYISARCGDPNLSVASIAEHFGFSKSYLLRAFKKYENCGVLDYIHQRRVDEAKKLLTETTETINDIALKTGYINALGFIRAFKRLEGITPTAYRELSRQTPR